MSTFRRQRLIEELTNRIFDKLNTLNEDADIFDVIDKFSRDAPRRTGKVKGVKDRVPEESGPAFIQQGTKVTVSPYDSSREFRGIRKQANLPVSSSARKEDTPGAPIKLRGRPPGSVNKKNREEEEDEGAKTRTSVETLNYPINADLPTGSETRDLKFRVQVWTAVILRAMLFKLVKRQYTVYAGNPILVKVRSNPTSLYNRYKMDRYLFDTDQPDPRDAAKVPLTDLKSDYFLKEFLSKGFEFEPAYFASLFYTVGLDAKGQSIGIKDAIAKITTVGRGAPGNASQIPIKTALALFNWAAIKQHEDMIKTGE